MSHPSSSNVTVEAVAEGLAKRAMINRSTVVSPLYKQAMLDDHKIFKQAEGWMDSLKAFGANAGETMKGLGSQLQGYGQANPPAASALIGAGIGGVGGGLYNWLKTDEDDPKRNVGGSALTGALAGAGIGGGYGLLRRHMDRLKNPPGKGLEQVLKNDVAAEPKPSTVANLASLAVPDSPEGKAHAANAVIAGGGTYSTIKAKQFGKLRGLGLSPDKKTLRDGLMELAKSPDGQGVPAGILAQDPKAISGLTAKSQVDELTKAMSGRMPQSFSRPEVPMNLSPGHVDDAMRNVLGQLSASTGEQITKLKAELAAYQNGEVANFNEAIKKGLKPPPYDRSLEVRLQALLQKQQDIADTLARIRPGQNSLFDVVPEAELQKAFGGADLDKFLPEGAAAQMSQPSVRRQLLDRYLANKGMTMPKPQTPALHIAGKDMDDLTAAALRAGRGGKMKMWSRGVVPSLGAMASTYGLSHLISRLALPSYANVEQANKQRLQAATAKAMERLKQQQQSPF